jgi:hypothetical protein
MVTTNMNAEQFLQKFGSAIASRVLGGYCIELNEMDRRMSEKGI